MTTNVFKHNSIENIFRFTIAMNLKLSILFSVSRLLEYTPSARITPLQACAHTFFDELREPGTKLPNGREMPPLFNFTEAELKIQPTLNSQLIPSHMASGMLLIGFLKAERHQRRCLSDRFRQCLMNLISISHSYFIARKCRCIGWSISCGWCVW